MSRLRRAGRWCRFVWTYVLRHPCNRGRPLAAIARVAAWQVRKRLTGSPAITRLDDGTALRVSREHVSSALALYVRLPEYDDMRFVRDVLRDSDWFVDVGANVGSYTVLAAARVPAGRVVAFEPDPVARGELERNVELNGLANVEVRPEAVGGAPGLVWFSESLDSLNHVVEGPCGGRGHLTPMVTLDSLAVPAGVAAVVKVDAEGHGGAVLDGARALLERAEPVVWILEVWGRERDLVDRLAGLGYRPWTYDPRTRRLNERGRSRWSENLIFVRSDGLAAVRRRLA